MNKIPQHKVSQYSERGVVLHHFSSTFDGHTPIQYVHQDDYYIFGLLTKGKACGIIDFKELCLEAGDVFLVQPGQVHRFVSSEDAEGWLMMADGRFVGSEEKCSFDNFSLVTSSFRIDEKRRDELMRIAMLMEGRLNDANSLQDNSNEKKADAVLARLTEAFVAVVAEAAQNVNSQKMTLNARKIEIVLTFREMLAKHLSTHRQPSYYASLLNLSTVYLNEVVKTVTGMSTALYIKGEVVLQAKRLLSNTTLSVKQIANRLGFDDEAYFSRLFSQVTGISPTEFRKKNLD